MIAVVRVRGKIGIKRDIERTLHLLRLRKKNHCVILNLDKNIVGMLNKIKHYVTWGEIDKETLIQLLKKRGRIAGNKRLTDEYLKEKLNMDFDQLAEKMIEGKISLKDIPGIKPFFRLKPPTKGFKNTKKDYSLGGDLGYRGKDINELLKRMI